MATMKNQNLAKKNVPIYIQDCIRRMLKHANGIRRDSQVVDAWIKRNKINRKIPLHKLISNNSKPKEKVIKGQLTIFDIIGGKDEH